MKKTFTLLALVVSLAVLGYGGTLELAVRAQGPQGVCNQVGPGLYRCSLVPEEETVLYLSARVDPKEGVSIWAEGLPPWARFKTARGYGEARARCDLFPPAGVPPIKVTFRAATASGLSAFLILELVPAFADPAASVVPPTGRYQLDWDDFRGAPPKAPGDAVAQIVYELGFRYACEAFPTAGGFVASLTEVEVRLRVRRDLSWVYPWARTPEVLRHEQGHLDIAEVYRRLLLETLRGLRVEGRTPGEAISLLGERAREIFREVKERMDRAQSLYDSATAHRKDLSAQHEWERKIALWLRDPSLAP